MFPPNFISRTKALLPDEYNLLEAALDASPPVSIRMNPRKPCILSDLHRKTPCDEKVPWCKTGYYLPERPSFTFDPLFHAGAYYVQEASSMFLEQAIARIREEGGSLPDPVTALDLCAAPGGKSTHLQTLLPEGSLLVSNETVRSRSRILSENMIKWGLPCQIITNNDPKDFGKLTSLFDIILADLPCSGEGMFRKDRAGRDEWSAEKVKLCAARQRRIVYDVWDTLKPGGWLIYSTCTFNTEENEENVYRLSEELGADVISIPVKPEWNIAGALQHGLPAYRFFPHRTRGEGFFLALMRKNRDSKDGVKIKHKDSRQPAIIPAEVKGMLSEPEKFVFFTREMTGSVFAVPVGLEDSYRLLSGQLHPVSAGVTLGEYKGRDFIPSISLALSTEINPGAFPSAELPDDRAIKYLQKETAILPEDTPKGYILITCRHLPLGFVKNIGNRTNNLYPQEWRIRSRKNPWL
ncbi:MAG: rRNA cytosine-C5-methyltransferase [Tannerella sp.]|jgi:16S rRNA C967 or C1407 C5-methylase (RsmB/RsmF family)/NOL1/NOP2/fmu family ribosome biogenesis protein|nr:rRNA cytosine-C5-methyltransferase [Tannerella sp.]